MEWFDLRQRLVLMSVHHGVEKAMKIRSVGRKKAVFLAVLAAWIFSAASPAAAADGSVVVR